MKPLTWLTWPLVVLILGVSLILVGVPMWMVERGYAPPVLLVAPVTTILGAVATGVASYVKGKYEMPPYMNDPSLLVVKSTPPPVYDVTGLEAIGPPIGRDTQVNERDIP